ncbi:MAG: hypothetical protein IPG90_21525 [Bacteroidetes bacterium]|nr:hypothetical protein [Bacteroidota bacterium]
MALGIAFLLFLIFAFTTGPFWMYYNLGASEAKIKQTPETIVLMGGGGFPGESNLMRAYYALKAAKAYPHAALILALPGMSSDSTSSVFLFRKYLIEQGLDSTRIRLECKGKIHADSVLKFIRWSICTNQSLLFHLLNTSDVL